MNCRRETAKMGVPPGNRPAIPRDWLRGVPEWYVAGAGTRGRQEGRQYPWSQQVIHEISGLRYSQLTRNRNTHENEPGSIIFIGVPRGRAFPLACVAHNIFEETPGFPRQLTPNGTSSMKGEKLSDSKANRNIRFSLQVRLK